MSPCNKSQVALWLWFFTEDYDFACNDLQLATFLKAPWLKDVHTRVPSMCLCAVYITRLTLVLPGAIQL